MEVLEGNRVSPRRYKSWLIVNYETLLGNLRYVKQSLGTITPTWLQRRKVLSTMSTTATKLTPGRYPKHPDQNQIIEPLTPRWADGLAISIKLQYDTGRRWRSPGFIP